MAPTTIASILYYYPTYSLLICERCPKTLTQKEATSHLKKHLSMEAIEQNSYLEELANRQITTMANSYAVIQQAAPIPPLQGLPVNSNGLRCTWPTCQFLTTAQEQIWQHLFKAHGVSRVSNTAAQLIQPCLVQSLSRKGFIFEVTPRQLPPTSPPTSPPNSAVNTTSEVARSEQWVEALQNKVNARKLAKKEAPVEIHYGRAEFSTFYNTTQAQYFWHGRVTKPIQNLLGNYSLLI